jgi:RNA polymerase sigma-70 factor, ECF subfamily
MGRTAGRVIKVPAPDRLRAPFEQSRPEPPPDRERATSRPPARPNRARAPSGYDPFARYREGRDGDSREGCDGLAHMLSACTREPVGPQGSRLLVCLVGRTMEQERDEAFDHLWATYPGLVRRLILIVRDQTEAEDLAQTAILRAWEAWTPSSIRDVRAWVYTIGTRLALNEARRRKRWGFISLAAGDRTMSVAVDPDLWAALASLDRMERAALVMQVLEGYTHQEIADRLRVPAGTVSSWLSRAKASLRQQLGE